MSPFSLKMGTSTLSLHADGMVSVVIMLLNSLQRVTTPNHPRHFHTSAGISSLPTAMPLFMERINSIIADNDQTRVNSTKLEGQMEMKKGNQRTSQISMAQSVIEEKRITFVPDRHAFLVTGSTNNTYAVMLFPKETCQCGSTATCHHIMAARLLLGMKSDHETKTLSLKQLRKNIRKRVDKKSGRKKPRFLDYDPNTTIVKPAPDSISTSTPKADITLSPLGLSLSTTSNISKTGTRRLSLNKSRKLCFDNINSGLPSQNNDDSKKAETNSQTTTPLRNKVTLEKVNSASKGSILKHLLNGEEKKVKSETNSLNGEEKIVKAETNSLNGEEKKVKTETNSQTNKLTLKKVNSSSKGSILKPTLNGEGEKVKEHKPSQITTRTLPNNTIMNTNNDDYKGRRKPSLNGDEDKSKTEALSIKTTTKLSTPVSNTKNTQTELRMGKAHKNCIIGKQICRHHITGTAFIIRLKLYVYIVENSETFQKIYSFMQFK